MNIKEAAQFRAIKATNADQLRIILSLTGERDAALARVAELEAIVAGEETAIEQLQEYVSDFSGRDDIDTDTNS